MSKKFCINCAHSFDGHPDEGTLRCLVLYRLDYATGHRRKQCGVDVNTDGKCVQFSSKTRVIEDLEPSIRFFRED